MAFIKIQNVVINTSYIAAIKLDNQTSSGEQSVSVLIAAPKFSLLQPDTIAQNICHYEWIEFTGQAANTLQDYFTSFNNAIDLLPQYQESYPNGETSYALAKPLVEKCVIPLC